MTRTNSKAVRLNDMIERLSTKPRSVTELAALYGVGRRTIERHLHDVEALHPGFHKTGTHHYAIDPKKSALNDVEALAVHSATRLLVHTGVGERHYRNALEKLSQQLPEPARGTLLRSVERLRPSRDDRTLDLVAQAWFQSRVLRCDYQTPKSDTPRRRELEIYYFEINRRNLEPYVLACDRSSAPPSPPPSGTSSGPSNGSEPRVFKLSRMTNVHVTQTKYEIPEGFTPDDFLEGSWGIVVGTEVAVRLHVDASVAFWFRERANRETNIRTIDERPDGSLDVTMTATATRDGSFYELMPFLLSWGPNVEVLEPTPVRDLIRQDLQRAAARYATPQTAREAGEPLPSS